MARPVPGAASFRQQHAVRKDNVYTFDGPTHPPARAVHNDYADSFSEHRPVPGRYAVTTSYAVVDVWKASTRRKSHRALDLE